MLPRAIQLLLLVPGFGQNERLVIIKDFFSC